MITKASLSVGIVVTLSIFLVSNSWGQEQRTVTVKTVTGKTYENAKVSRVTPEGLVISHPGGIVTIPFTELPANVQEFYGYDPAAAEKSRMERQAAEANRQRMLAEREKEAARKAEEARAREEEEKKIALSKPQIVTERHIKNYWLNTFPQPNSLDSDYHQKKEEYSKLINSINSGKMDNSALRCALKFNIAEYQRVGDLEKAASVQKDLEILEQKVAEERRNAELAGLSRQLSILNSTLNSISTSHQLIRYW